ncbi:MAG: DUF456 domain-containing protein [Gammaproteobacteria bacterium]
MDPALVILLWIVAAAMVGVGLAGAVVPVLPGVPLVFGGLWLAAWIDGYARVGVVTLVVLAVLTVLAILVDFVASALGAQRVGASRQAIWGSVLGSLIGLFFGLPGIILGPFVGAVIGELSARGGLAQAANVGVATWLGLLFGTIAKLAASLAMIGIFLLAFFV